MTESQWLASVDPTPILEWLGERVSPRKLRLFTASCLRRVLPLLLEEECRRAVEVLERYADGKAGEEEWENTRDKCQAVGYDAEEDTEYPANECLIRGVFDALCCAYAEAAYEAANAYAWGIIGPDPGAAREKQWNAAYESEKAVQCRLLREVVGNPFRPITVDSRWLSENVLALAKSMCDSRDFNGMAAVADALEETGCQAPDLLAHCRESNAHDRGCWVVDLLLGRP